MAGVCFDFQDGNCSRGDGCRFSHDLSGATDAPRGRRGGGRSRGPGVCYDFRDNGECARGDACRFSHGDAGGAGGAGGGGSGWRSVGVCYDFQDGNCTRGEGCRFSHDLSGATGEAAPRRAPRTESRSCYNCGESGHISRNCPTGGAGGEFGGADTRTCFVCSGVGHIARDCPNQAQEGGEPGFAQ